MKKTATIFKYEFGRTIKRKGFILVTLAIPLLLMLIYGIYEGVQSFTEPDEPTLRQLGYVDYTGIFDEHTVLYNTTTFVPYESEEAAKDALLEKDIDEYFVIQSDYLFNAEVDRYITKRELEISNEKWAAIRDFLVLNLSDELSDLSEEEVEIVNRVGLPLSLETTTLEKTGEVAAVQDEATKYLLPFVFGLLFIFALMFSAGSLFQSVTEEKENRIIEILLSSVSSKQLLAGKILGMGIAGLIQVAVWFSSIKIFTEIPSIDMPVVNDLSIPMDLLAWGIIYFVFGYLLFAALFAALGSISSNAREAQQASGLLVIPAIVPLWLNYFIISNPEGTVAKVLSFIPFTAPLTAMMRLPVDAMATWELIVSYLIMIFSILIATWIAAKIFRTYLLMYGKGPSLRELARYLRQA